MNRRDFLLLKSERGVRSVELSCQRLHMYCLERRVTSGPPLETFDPYDDGEPPTAFDERTTAQLFEKLRQDLDGVELVSVVGAHWLEQGDEDLRSEFDSLIDSFRARGGRVEFI